MAADAGDTASFIPNGEWALMGELANSINENKNVILTFITECLQYAGLVHLILIQISKL